MVVDFMRGAIGLKDEVIHAADEKIHPKRR